MIDLQADLCEIDWIEANRGALKAMEIIWEDFVEVPKSEFFIYLNNFDKSLFIKYFFNDKNDEKIYFIYILEGSIIALYSVETEIKYWIRTGKETNE